MHAAFDIGLWNSNRIKHWESSLLAICSDLSHLQRCGCTGYTASTMSTEAKTPSKKVSFAAGAQEEEEEELDTPRQKRCTMADRPWQPSLEKSNKWVWVGWYESPAVAELRSFLHFDSD